MQQQKNVLIKYEVNATTTKSLPNKELDNLVRTGQQGRADKALKQPPQQQHQQ